MSAKRQVKLPFFEIGPKSYLYGDDILELAKIADRASEKYGVEAIEGAVSLPSAFYRKNFMKK